MHFPPLQRAPSAAAKQPPSVASYLRRKRWLLLIKASYHSLNTSHQCYVTGSSHTFTGENYQMLNKRDNSRSRRSSGAWNRVLSFITIITKSAAAHLASHPRANQFNHRPLSGQQQEMKPRVGKDINRTIAYTAFTQCDIEPLQHRPSLTAIHILHPPLS